MRRPHIAPGEHAGFLNVVDGIAQDIEALRQVYGAVPVITPEHCASCAAPLPPEPREVMGVGVMHDRPIVFFLCADCRTRLKHDPRPVEDRVYRRIDAAAHDLAMLERNAEA